MINEASEQLGIMPTDEALDLAAKAGLQLVEVNPKASPPVCKIMDYGKFKYETAKREREAKKHQKQLEVKEVKFRPKTHEHDYEFKVRHVRRFLEDGDKVRLLVQFRGREIVHPETGRAILEKVCKDVADLASVSQMASMEGNRMNMILAPKIRRDSQQPARGTGKRPEGAPPPRKQPDAPAAPEDSTGAAPPSSSADSAPDAKPPA